ncbi:MAG: uroporphyrinogen decarboxylase family protein [Bacteroidales bacterium]|nr:uroporphyrinogen decarboxylase family protein [Bacteroidales bacterium]
MNKKQRLNSLAEKGKSVEKVIFRPILMQFAAEFIGNNYGEFASDYRVLVDANLACMEEFQTDMVGVISDPYRETSAFGARIKFVKDGVPRCLDTLVNSIDDVKALRRPDLMKAERTLDRIKAAESMVKKTHGKVPVIGWIEGPLAEACDLTGMENMFIQLMMDADFCNLLLDKCLQTGKDFAKAQLEAGCDIIGIGDAVCSQIDVHTYNQYVKNRHHELISYIHELGGKVKLHICGDTNHLLPSYKEFQLDILDLDYQVDIKHARAVLGPEVILGGNINPIEVMNKSEAEVEIACRELVNRHKGERFILSAGCEISPLTPPENLKAMSLAAHL